MRILYVAAEVGPYVSVGGLSQVLFFLPRAMAKQGNEVAIFTPKFATMDDTAPTRMGWKLKNEYEGLEIPVEHGEASGGEKIICNVKSYKSKSDNVRTFFLENREYYELRANVFGYKDDHERFMLLCKGCLEWLLSESKKKNGWWPDIIHCNDWHAAYLIELARKSPKYAETFRKVPIGLTVHNFTYQGNYDYRYCATEDRDDGKNALLPLNDENMVKQNPMMRGIMYADAVTTVSPTHAREVLTAEYGEGLEELLRRERGKLTGILNGLDIDEFDPASDPLVPFNFDKHSLGSMRPRNKKMLQAEFGLPKLPKSFLMAYSGRLTNQKGLSLLQKVVSELLPEHPDYQLVILGGGEDNYRRAFTELAHKYPKQIGLHLLPNFKLPRLIFAGADAVVIPSLFEPGGIVALEALRYGAIPIVRRTGGLNDIVEEFDPETGKGNGFSFTEKNPWALYGAVMAAATTYRNPVLWNKLILNAMNSKTSWDIAAKKYRVWYQRTIEMRKRMIKAKPNNAYIKSL